MSAGTNNDVTNVAWSEPTTLPPPLPPRAYLSGHAGPHELDAVVDHVVADEVGALLVEAAQQDGAHHDGGVEPEAGQEAGALQRHVRRADHQRLARAIRQREQVVTVAVRTGSH